MGGGLCAELSTLRETADSFCYREGGQLKESVSLHEKGSYSSNQQIITSDHQNNNALNNVVNLYIVLFSVFFII